MQQAMLKFDGREIIIDRDVTTIGRIPENVVSFPEDSNVSRYHAEIEIRGGDHWLIDLQSSNGTTINGSPLKGERRLEPGDKIVFGGSSTAEFIDAATATPTDKPASGDAGPAGTATPGMPNAGSEIGSFGNEIESKAGYAAGNAIRNAVGSGSTPAAVSAAAPSSGSTVIIAGAVVGIAVVCAVAAGAFYYTRGSSQCKATATIVAPESGDTISGPVDIVIKTQNADCVASAIFTIDGKEVASADASPFSAALVPKEVAEFSDGVDHALQVILIDSAGTTMPQPGSVLLAFETRASTKPTPTPGPSIANTQPAKQTGRGQPSLVQINDMAQKFVKQFSAAPAYSVSNKQFLQEVQKQTAEYAQEGYYQRAAAFREAITVAFVREQNIDAPFGFVLAMSRSKFLPAKQGDREGIWQMSGPFVNDNKYNGQCPTEPLSDPSQNCAARSAAIYAKALIFGVFDLDPIYSAAVFGKSTQDAAIWKSTFPANRSDLWNVVRTPEEREQLVRFFAAGIVAENPQAFGLTKEQPLSELYRVTMQK